MNTKIKRAQSILEYLVTLTVIIGAVVAGSSYLKSKVGSGVNSAANSIYNSYNGNPTIGGVSGNSSNPTDPTDPVDPVNPPGPTTPVSKGSLPVTSVAGLYGNVTVYLPNSIPNPTPGQVAALQSVGIIVGGWGTGSTIMEQSSTGYLSAAQRAKINELWP